MTYGITGNNIAHVIVDKPDNGHWDIGRRLVAGGYIL